MVRRSRYAGGPGGPCDCGAPDCARCGTYYGWTYGWDPADDDDREGEEDMHCHVERPDGSKVRLDAQDGPPVEPGLYLAEYHPVRGPAGTVARLVRIDGAGCLDYGPDSARLVWWARVVPVEEVAP